MQSYLGFAEQQTELEILNIEQMFQDLVEYEFAEDHTYLIGIIFDKFRFSDDMSDFITAELENDDGNIGSVNLYGVINDENYSRY